MKFFFRSTLSFVLVLSIILGFCSCKRVTKPSFEECDEYYSYKNVSYGKHERHKLDVVVPKGDNVPSGIILYIHGGGWFGGDKEVYGESIVSSALKGYVSATVNYRYADGHEITCNDILNDINSALVKIKDICNERGISADKVMLTGASAGGHLALMYAYTRSAGAPISPVAVVSYSGPTELCDDNYYNGVFADNSRTMISKITGADLFSKTIEESVDLLLDASPVTYVNEDTVPTIICHGTLDDIVPYSNATVLQSVLLSYDVDCELITYENSGHGLDSDPETAEYAKSRFYELADKYLK